MLLLRILPFIKRSVSMLGTHAFRCLSQRSTRACRENKTKPIACASLQQAVCLASSRGRGRLPSRLPDVPSRGSPSTPRAQEASREGAPGLVEEGLGWAS